MDLRFRELPGSYAVVRQDPAAPFPKPSSPEDLFSVTLTRNELSLVCREESVPLSGTAERGWRALELAGPIPFDAVGIAARFTTLLANEGISVFVLSTYDTDYLLVKGKDLERTMEVLSNQEG